MNKKYKSALIVIIGIIVIYMIWDYVTDYIMRKEIIVLFPNGNYYNLYTYMVSETNGNNSSNERYQIGSGDNPDLYDWDQWDPVNGIEPPKL